MTRHAQPSRAVMGTLGALALVVALIGPAAAQEAPPLLLPGSITPAVLTAGEQAVQTLNLSRPAPPGGTLVALSGGDPLYKSLLLEGSGVGVARVVPEGRTSISFPVRFQTHVDVPRVATSWATVSQSGIGYAANAQVTVVPPDPAVQAVVALEGPASAVAERPWHQPSATPSRAVTLDARLRSPAPPGGLVVTIFGSGAGNGVGVSPERSSVFFPAGSTATTVRVRVHTNVNPHEIQASLELGTTRATWSTLAVPEQFAVSGGYGERGSTTTGIVGLGDVSNPDGATVGLRSDSPGVRVPAAVFVPPGEVGVRFPVTIAGDAEGSEPYVTAPITATWLGRSVTGDLAIVGPVVPDPSPSAASSPSPSPEPAPPPTPTRTPTPSPSAEPSPPPPTPSPQPTVNAAPRAVADVTCRRTTCTWDASGSSDRDGAIVGHRWQFSDGATSDGAHVTRSFAAPGSYDGTVTVTDDRGAVGIISTSIDCARRGKILLCG